MKRSLPINVITGFLGSGKTTLLAQMLTHPGLSRTLVVVNDFGEVGLDYLLLARVADEVISLDEGCLCCTLQGDLVDTLKSIVARRALAPEFDRVVVETTGLADPTGILHTLLRDPEIAPHFSVDSVITVVDSLNGAEALESHAVSVFQVLAADHLLVSKTDLVPEGKATALMRRLQDLNPIAEQHICTMGRIDPSLFLTSARKNEAALVALESIRRAPSLATQSDPGTHAGQNHLTHDSIRTFTLRLRRPVIQEGSCALDAYDVG